jgi:dTDP-4-dehydrorhamnose 3,5-epimerase
MTRAFRSGEIAGVIWRPLRKHCDHRGWLSELYREDEVPPEYHPVMGYISETLPGVVRGPHEHYEQTDYFCFFGPSNFRLYLWDNRPQSETYGVRQEAVVGADNPTAVIVPPGVVHAYQNIGPAPGWVLNLANRLYKGPGRQEPVDEIRHETRPDSPFTLDLNERLAHVPS